MAVVVDCSCLAQCNLILELHHGFTGKIAGQFKNYSSRNVRAIAFKFLKSARHGPCSSRMWEVEKNGNDDRSIDG
jgi:hypothetical protein